MSSGQAVNTHEHTGEHGNAFFGAYAIVAGIAADIV